MYIYLCFSSSFLVQAITEYLSRVPFAIQQFLQFSLAAQLCPLFATSWTAACQASLSITNSWSLLTPTCNELVMPSNHLILCRPLLLPPSIFPSIRVFSNESALRIRWPKYWSFSFSISPSNEYSGLILIGHLFEMQQCVYFNPKFPI